MSGHFLSAARDQSKVGRIIERLVLCFFTFMTLIIISQFLVAGFNEWAPAQYVLLAGVASILYCFAVILGCCLIIRTKASSDRILGAIIILSLIVRLLLVAIIPTEPVSDFLGLYKMAQSVVAGDFSWSHTQSGYFYWWGYQIPFVLYEAAILRLFRSILALKLLNVLFMTGTNYLLYRIGKLYLSEKAALCMALIYAVFPDSLSYTTVLTNQIIALFFLLIGVLLLLQAARWWEFALAGFVLALSDLMRPEAVVILTACLCCGVLRCIQSPNIGVLRRIAISLVLVLGCYWLTKGLTERVLIWTDIAPNGIRNRVPEWKVVLGLGNVEGFGTYSEKHGDILYMNSADRRAVTVELIRDLFCRPVSEILNFFVGKLRSFWASPPSTGWTLGGMDSDQLGLGLPLISATILKCGGSSVNLLSYLLAVPAPILLWKDDKKRRGEWLFCVAVVCIIICVFLLIEIQPRYRFFAMPFWLLIGGVTIERLTPADDAE